MKNQKEIDEKIQFASKGWVHPSEKKARERFRLPITDYGKGTCKNESK